MWTGGPKLTMAISVRDWIHHLAGQQLPDPNQCRRAGPGRTEAASAEGSDLDASRVVGLSGRPHLKTIEQRRRSCRTPPTLQVPARIQQEGNAVGRNCLIPSRDAPPPPPTASTPQFTLILAPQPIRVATHLWLRLSDPLATPRFGAHAHGDKRTCAGLGSQCQRLGTGHSGGQLPRPSRRHHACPHANRYQFH